jgi:pimeloyl-ACP methyl ester carboxylesterase
LFARVNEKPLEIDIAHPLTGKKEHVKLTRAGLASMLRGPLYVSLTASLLPSAIEAASRGDFDELAALNLTVSSSLEDSVALGMHLSVICSEDLLSTTSADRAAAKVEATKSTLDGRPNPVALIYDDQYRQLCAQWPTRRPPVAYFETLKGRPGSNVPTLLLSGGIDPATPPAHAEAVARTLTNARHLIAPNVGHGVALQGCAPDLIETFIKSADAKALKPECLAAIPRPPFFSPILESHRDHDSATVP